MTNRIAEILKRPGHAINSRFKAWSVKQHYKKLSVQDAFAEIYRSQRWGTREGAVFCSGEGSTKEDLIAPYCAEVQKFIQSHQIREVVDLGCGDFNVGSRLRGHVRRYTGVDIVPDLIDYNRKHFGDSDVNFECLNIIDDELPQADLCLVRQVLQHLSNTQIERILPKFGAYKFIVVTEHVYRGSGFKPNLDKPQGPGTRIPKHSGVYLDAPPFNKAATVLLEISVTADEALRMLAIEGNPH